MGAFLLGAALVLSPAAAAPTGSALLDRIQSVDPATATPAACEAQVSQATVLNGPDLFFGASVCSLAGKPVEATFLLNAAQNRSIVDLMLIVPATRADSDRTMELYGFIYYSAGGPGGDEVFRDPALRDRLFTLYDNWSPAYGPDYSPGWSARRRPQPEAYQAAVTEAKASRRRQLSETAQLYSDESYYALHRRFQELQRRTSGTYVEGTADANLSRELQRRMSERAAELGVRDSGFEEGQPGDRSPPEFPPNSPASEEVVLPHSSDPVVERCTEIAERRTIASGSRLVRVLITRSPEWGIIWRADSEGGDGRPTRFTCTATTISSSPLGSEGPESLAPLPEATEPPAAPH